VTEPKEPIPFVRLDGEIWQACAVRIAYANGVRPTRVLGEFQRVRPDYQTEVIAWVQALRNLGVDVVLPIGGEESECDFCTSKPTTRSFPARTYLAGITHDGRFLRSVGDWAACAKCAELIDANEPDRLAHHATTKLVANHPLAGRMSDLALRARVLENVRTMHAMFFENRIV
jgi:hypothetical protein